MKKITLFLAILTCSFLSSQTFTYAAFSNGLTSPINARIANINSFNVTPITGSGVTWDASGLLPQSGYPVIHFGYYSPSSTTHSGLYPNSNYVQFDPALTTILEYNYMAISSTEITSQGTYAPSGVHEIFQNPDKWMTFPFSFNESFVDDYSKTNYSDATTISSTQTGTRTVSFLGSGILKLPQGTFNNVALIKDVRTNSLGSDTYKYTWWDLSNGKQLLVYSSNNNTVVYNIDLPLSTINQNLDDMRISLTPNPTKDSFMIQTEKKGMVGSVEIYNTFGQKIFTSNSKEAINPVISISSLAKGVCFVKFNLSGKTYISKLIIE